MISILTDKFLLKRITARIVPSCFYSKTHNSYYKNDFCYLLSFDIDSKEDVFSLKKIVEIFSSSNIKLNFAVTGKYLELYPNEHKCLSNSNVEVVNHSYSHPFHQEFEERRIDELVKDEIIEQIEKTDNIIYKLLKIKPIGWRTPHFGCQKVKNLHLLLKDKEYRYSTSVCDFELEGGIPKIINGIIELPLTSTSKRPFSVFDSWSYRTGSAPILSNNKEFFKLWKKEIILAKENGYFINHYFDPHHLLQDNLAIRMVKFIIENNIRTSTYCQYIKEYEKFIK